MLKNIIIPIIFLYSISAFSDELPKPPQTITKQQTNIPVEAQNKANKNKEATNNPIPIIPASPAINSDKQSKSKSDDASNEGSEFWPPLIGLKIKITDSLLVLFNFLLFFATAGLWLSTEKLWKAAEQTSEATTRDMQSSIIEANRSAVAMEEVAEATKNNAVLMQGMMHKQMRAYVAVNTGNPAYQDANNRFAGEIIIENTGFTPARNVSYSIKSGILPINPDSLPVISNFIVNDIGLAPRQSFRVSDVIEETFSEIEIKEIMLGNAKKLFVWGKITYDDVYGGSWETNFCHSYIWVFDKDGKIANRFDYYYKKHNYAT